MQAIIMAAGKGSRLGGITQDRPKAFLEIQGIKLIEYNISMLHAFGVRDIILVTGYHCEEFEKLSERISGIRCIFNPFYEMVNVLGSFYVAQDCLTEDFIYLHGDTLCDMEILERALHSKGDMALPVDYRTCDGEAMKVRTKDGRITEINKTMPCDRAEGEFIGIAVIRQSVIKELKEASRDLMKQKVFDAYFEGAVQRVIDRGIFDIRAIPTEGRFWGEVDFPEDYQKMKAEIPESLVKVAGEEFGVA